MSEEIDHICKRCKNFNGDGSCKIFGIIKHDLNEWCLLFEVIKNEN